MGQVIRLSALSTAYPDAVTALDAAESTFLNGVRWWVADHRRGEDPLTRLCGAMEQAGSHDAAFSLDRLMAVVARTVRQPVAVHCPRCPRLSDDEKRLLHAASLAQAGGSDRAERLLRNAMLTSIGAEFAIGPLEGLGALFADVGLLFSQRPLAAADLASADVEAWIPPPSRILN